MADIELVIKLSEQDYELACKYPEVLFGSYARSIKNGTPLPKTHGRLIDAEEVIKIANKTKDIHGAIWNASTIIAAEREGK